MRTKDNELPELRGLRLGMTIDEVRTRFPGIFIGDADAAGKAFSAVVKAKGLNVNVGFDLEGIAGLFITFLDGRISEIHVMYDNTQLKTPGEFTSKIAETLNLPDKYASEHQCYDFSVRAYFFEQWGGGPDKFPSVYLEDAAASKVLSDRMRQIEQLERKLKQEQEQRESNQRKEVFRP